ncbi:DUF2782 domain-containing protein [Thioalkalivibrio sp. HK1]|uniref:DUF2782 domain-containing protein n=1 Tax=Thioalkalivibrio sp. HK1 TaxID=1469245 RepID=UPI0018CC4637|nr:DUF2782 domain-containing protein [Thioalkalivibrio sp. HK1]
MRPCDRAFFRSSLLIVACIVGGAGVQADDSTQRLESLLDLPPPPPQIQSGQALAPAFTPSLDSPTEKTPDGIEERWITEYPGERRLQAVKIQPGVFPRYWLIDADGNGRIESPSKELEPSKEGLPHWSIIDW